MSTATLPSYTRGTASVRGAGLLGLIPLIPRDVVLALLLGYRSTISHIYGDVCRYYPSCSAYAVGAVQQHGVILGMVLGLRRILRCHPWAAGGIDDVPARRGYRYDLTPHGFVVPIRKD